MNYYAKQFNLILGHSRDLVKRVKRMNRTSAKAYQELLELGQQEELPELFRFYRELLQIQDVAKSRITVTKPDFSADLIARRLQEGIPLVGWEDFSPDWEQVQTTFEQIITWAQRGSKMPPDEKISLRRICRDAARMKMLSEAWYAGETLADVPAVYGIDEALLASAIGSALKPFLSAYAELLMPEVKQELWRRRYCPICSGGPDFAYLDKEKGARWLLCSCCNAGWLFQRLECPYCGTQDQNTLAYFFDEGSRLYRLYVCDECRTYIKAIDLRCASKGVLLPLQRVMTLDIDRQAHEAGYKAGQRRGFRFHSG